MEQQHTNDEIDLGLVFKKIGDLWRSFLVWIFNCIQFVLRNWIVLLLLIAGGIGLGYLWEANSVGEKKTIMILQTNFGSAHYVYDAIDVLKKVEKDPHRGKTYGFDSENRVLKELEISPFVDIIKLTSLVRDQDRVFEEFMASADFEDELLTSSVFIDKYKYHELELTTSGDAPNTIIQSIMTYLNDNDFYKKAQVIGKAEIQAQISNHIKSIAGIDAVMNSYENNAKTDKDGPQYVFNSSQSSNLHLLLGEKRNIMNDVEELKIDLINMDKPVSLINTPKMYYAFSILDMKSVLLPIVLVVLFVLISWFFSFYKRMSAKQA